MNTCANCRHWRPHAGNPTTGSAGSSATNGDNAAPRIILDLVRQKPAGHSMVLATPSGFGCSLYEDQPPEPSR